MPPIVDQATIPSVPTMLQAPPSGVSPPGPSSVSVAQRECVMDCAFLAAVVALSFVTYISSVGFYSDDWSALGWISVSSDQSVLGRIDAVLGPIVRQRPMQAILIGINYSLFGDDPLGPHLVNGGLLIAATLFFYLALRELRLTRQLALAIPVVYALLPHYSTVRFWALSPPIALSMSMYFLSLLADLRAAQATGSRTAIWKTLAIVALLVSTLAYEVALPFFLLNAVLVWFVARKRGRTAGASPPLYARHTWLALCTLLVLIPVVWFKLATTIRLPHTSKLQIVEDILPRIVRRGFGANDYGLNVWRAIDVHVGTYGLELPRIVWRAVRDYPDVARLTIALLIGAFVMWYLQWVGRRTEQPTRRQATALVAAGFLVYCLGYSIFLSSWAVQFSATGLANRTAAAAAVGIAMCFVGAAGWGSSLLRSGTGRRWTFAALVGALSMSWALIVSTIGAFWTEAYVMEKRVLARIQAAAPSLPRGSTLLLDGVCPYHGPAIVFESNWDLAGALMMIYRDAELRADVVTPRLEVGDEGLRTSLYGVTSVYPYRNLSIYDDATGRLHLIRDAGHARAYFSTSNPDRGRRCPKGSEGMGVRIF